MLSRSGIPSSEYRGASRQNSPGEASAAPGEQGVPAPAEPLLECFWFYTADWKQLLYVSPAFERIWGQSRDELRRDPLCWMQAVLPEDRPRMLAFRESLPSSSTDAKWIEFRIMRPDGVMRWVRTRAFPISDESGVVQQVAGVSEDVTVLKEREAMVRQSQERHGLMTAVLSALNSASSVEEMVGQVVGLLAEHAGFEAVGIRLRDGDAYPFVGHSGFSAAFIRAEDELCRRAADGTVACDASGQAELECVCGDVLRGRTQGTISCFTRGGSFWTGRASVLAPLLDGVPRTLPLRKRCSWAGYESIVLVPLRQGNQTIGLLHFADPRPDRCTQEGVEFLERVAATVGIGLARLQAEQQRQASEERCRAIVDHAASLIASVDRNGTIVGCNGRSLRMLGYEPAELIGASIEKVVHPDDMPAARTRLANIAQQGLAIQNAYRMIRKDGTLIRVTISSSPLLDEHGELEQAICIIDDVTDRLCAEELARQHREELVHLARLTTVGEIASTLAHELNQPLGAIANYSAACSEALRRGQAGSGTVAIAIEEIAAESHRAGEIIRRVRTFVRKQAPNRHPTEISVILRDAIGLMGMELRRHELQCRSQVADDLPPVVADAVQVQQVLVNLIQNAIDAMQGSPAPDRAIAVKAGLDAGAMVRVSVSDSGRGIDPKMRGRLFESFASTKANGLGMGLAISRSIIESHGGRLSFVSSPEHGTTFEFTLPTRLIDVQE